MHRWLGFVALIGGLVGCERSLFVACDDLLFTRWGRTVLAHPGSLTLKEIHLGSGSYAGEDVVVEGKVVELSRHGTYTVISDDEARLLVVLTDLLDDSAIGSGLKGSVRFLGTVERGRKGLPLLRARAVSLRDLPNAVATAGKA